ncbi:MAG: amino acid ABC transporter permease [Pseudomonadota bacterium]
MTDVTRGARPKAAIWNDRDFRGVLAQVVTISVIVAVVWYLVHNTLTNLAARHIATGFGFLNGEAGFGISESVIPFSPANTYLRALAVGLLNTLKIAVVGIVLATLWGTILGVARLSTNWLIRKLTSWYVEIFRNTPLLLQLFLWYAVVQSLPPARQPFKPLPGVFLSQKGLVFPVLEPEPIHLWMALLGIVGVGVAWWWAKRAKAHQMATGQIRPVLLPALGAILGLPLIAWLVAGAPWQLEIPELRGFNFAGGATISPELVALLFGLVMYTASYIAEIVRAGILAVPRGQTEAARALGLPGGRILRLVVLPQALRVIVPPTTSQYLNLTKNSSLAVAIGFPDLMSVVNTTINQTGQAVEAIALAMAVYLTISLAISTFMNWYNARIRLVER